MSQQIQFHESTYQILVYNSEPTIKLCKNPVSLLKGFLCYIFTPGSQYSSDLLMAKIPRQRALQLFKLILLERKVLFFKSPVRPWIS